MGEGVSLTTARLSVLPLTLWNAGVVADELAPVLPLAPGRRELREALRRRATAPSGSLTWVLRVGQDAAVGLACAELSERHTLVSITVGAPYRRRGYATEVLRAVASWLEARHRLVVEARAAERDAAARRLFVATGFVPTPLVEGDERRWLRPPVSA